MDPTMMALLQFLMGGMGGQVGQGDFQSSMANAQSADNDAVAKVIGGGGFSPVNSNPNYGGTVSRFFNQNPLAGSQPYTGTNPLQSGMAGNNASRSFKGHSSFLPNDFSSTMQQWV